MLNEKDIGTLNQLGFNLDAVEKQLSQFRNGIEPINLLKPATIGSGISKFSDTEMNALAQVYFNTKEDLDIVKFVPASGAATRMFKCLFQGLKEIETGIKLNNDAKSFLNSINQFAFHEELNTIGAQETISKVLFEGGLNYGNSPKALISFHKEKGEVKTAIEEHFVEAISYANSKGIGKIHLTVSEEHLSAIKSITDFLESKYEANLDIDVEFSLQQTTTNTIAVYPNNDPVRTPDGKLVFRPAGHGALLNNLNDIEAQLIFVKNIDNVSAKKWQAENAFSKKTLAGRLIELKDEIHTFLNHLELTNDIQKASDFIYNHWEIRVSSAEEIKNILDRPIRVCGMVENTGAPGGGPFWVKEKNGDPSLQIVESAQVDLNNPEQKSIWESSTHFNPVDLVCWVEDHKGQKFDLHNFRDDESGFISAKSFDGKEIKALELPGLWNGAMQGWITEFVEVPLRTFNPVKTVLDLLNEGHRS